MSRFANIKRQNYMITIKVVVMIALIICIGNMPPVGTITPMGMRVLGAFIGTLFGWLTLDFIVGSLVGLLALGLAGYAGGIAGTFASGFSDTTVVLMIFSFILVAGLNKVDLTGGLASWFLTRKFAEGRPYVLIAMIMLSAFIMGAVNALATFLLLWNVMYKVAERVGWQKQSAIMAYLLCGIVFFAGGGGYLFPWKGLAIMFASPLKSALDIAVSSSLWYFSFIIANLAFILLYIFLAIVLKLDFSALKDKKIFEDMRGQTWTKKQKWGLVLFSFIVLFLTLPEFLPPTAITSVWKSYGLIGATIIVITAGYMISVDGERLFPNVAELCKEGMMWDVWLITVATTQLSAAMRSADTGIIDTIVNISMNIVGDMHWLLFTIVCAIVLGLLAQVIHNIIMCMVLFPPFLQICVELGGDPLLWFFVNFFAIAAAYTTPAASGWSAVMHGNRDWIASRYAYGFGFSTLVVSWLGCFLVLIPLWLLLF